MKINPISFSSIQKGQYEKNKGKEDTFENTLKKAKESKDDKKLLDACRQFESMFIHMMLKNMRNTIHDDGFIKKSYARETFEGMLDEKLAEEIAKGQGVGLAKEMYKQISMKYKKNVHSR